jgi:hypothetical protein
MTAGEVKISIVLEILQADKNAKKFSTSLKSVEVGQDKVTTSSKKLESQTVQLRSKLQNIGLTVQGLSAGFGILKSTFGDLVSAYQQQEIALKKLENGLRNVGEGASSLARLNNQASELQKITVYGDEEIVNAQAMLTTFKKSSEEIEILTPRLLDMAAAFDQSGEGGQSLQQVAVMLGKVNEETIGALARVGVAFSKEQAEKLKSLKGTEQAIYLSGILDENFKDLSKTIGDTAAGKLKIFQNNVGDLKEKLGELISNALTPLLTPLGKFIDYLNNAPEGVHQTVLAVGSLTLAFTFLNGSIPTTVKIIAYLLALLPSLPPALQGVAIALGGVALALKATNGDIGSLLTGFRSLSTTGVSSIKTFASGLVANLGPASIAFIAILALVSLIQDLINLYKDLDYWKKKTASIEENQTKIETSYNSGSDATDVPLVTDEKGNVKILTEQEAIDAGIHPTETDKTYGPEITPEQRELLKTTSEAPPDSKGKGSKGSGKVAEVNEQITRYDELKKQLEEVNSQIVLNAGYQGAINDLLVERKKIENEIRYVVSGTDYNKLIESHRKITSELIEQQRQESIINTQRYQTELDAYLRGTEDIHNLRIELMENEHQKRLAMIEVERSAALNEINERNIPDSQKKELRDLTNQKFNKQINDTEGSFKNQLEGSLSLASQITSILGLGADNFITKFIGGLQQGIGLVTGIVKLLGLFGTGGASGIFSILGFASGGEVPGSGSGDTVPAMLTPGEYVINKARASQLGGKFLNWLNGGGSVQSMAPGAFAYAGGGGGKQIVEVPYIVSHKVAGNDLKTILTRVEKTTGRRPL